MITALFIFGGAVLVFFVAQEVFGTHTARRLPRPRVAQRPPSPHTPHWAREGRIPPQATAAASRHRRPGGTR